MPRPLRCWEPEQLVEITARTLQGRMLLVPEQRFNSIVAGVLGRGLELYPVKIYALVFLSNHFHLLLSGESTKSVSDFMRYIMGNISVEVGHLRDWKGSTWERRHRAIPAVDQDAILQRFRYILANGCKEGLVCHPGDWPGLNSIDALCEGTPIKGIWIDRTSMYRSKRHRPWKKLKEEDFTQETSFQLSPLPMWSHLTREAQRGQAQGIINDLASEYARARSGRRAIERQRKKQLALHPHTRPSTLARSPAPLCHASTKENLAGYLEMYHQFVTDYRAALSLVRIKLGTLGFPPHSQVLGTLVANTS